MATLKPKNVLFGVPGEFDLEGLTHEELELIQSGLLEFKNRVKTDAEFINERLMCDNLYNAIDQEVIKIKEQELCQHPSRS